MVGFSKNAFDQKAARQQLALFLKAILEKNAGAGFELVSGYTNMGVPKIAYSLADELGLTAVGFSAKQALYVKIGCYPVKKEILVGEKFGDESEAFVRYIDLLIRIGGGPQSRREVEMFKNLHAGEDLTELLFECEVAWFGT